MLENIEIGFQLKHDFKVMSTENNIYMKDLIVNEAENILSSDHTVPVVEREENYTSLIIDISEDLKRDVKDYCQEHRIRIRDFWIECIQESMRRYNDSE